MRNDLGSIFSGCIVAVQLFPLLHLSVSIAVLEFPLPVRSKWAFCCGGWLACLGSGCRTGPGKNRTHQSLAGSECGERKVTHGGRFSLSTSAMAAAGTRSARRGWQLLQRLLFPWLVITCIKIQISKTMDAKLRVQDNHDIHCGRGKGVADVDLLAGQEGA